MNRMIQKKDIKYLISLKNKKFRILNKEFVIEGSKLILDALQNNQPIKKIIYSNKVNHFDEIRKYAKKNDIDLNICSKKDAERISDTKNSQQIFALLKYSPFSKINSQIKLDGPIIVIEDISDPGNMGTILRTCSWFGCNNIMITDNSVEVYNPKTVRAAMGAHFHIKNICRDTIENFITYLDDNNYKMLAADMEGTNITKYKKVHENWALFLGNEARGLSKICKEKAQSIHIPGNGKMESLNVAEAASIVIHYLYKK